MRRPSPRSCFALALLAAIAAVAAGCGEDRSARRSGLVDGLTSGKRAAASGQTPARADRPPVARGAVGDVDTDFVGRWVERSTRTGSEMTVQMTLRTDGSYTAVAEIRASSGGGLTATTRGRWGVRSGDVLLVVEDSDRQALFPPGSIKRYADAATLGDAWTYTDADGSTRTIRRDPVADAAPR